MAVGALKWYKRSSLMYALGIWTMFGSCIYYTVYKQEPAVVMTKREEEEDTSANVTTVTTDYSTVKITYKENFVPYSTRFLNALRSTVGSSEPQANDK